MSGPILRCLAPVSTNALSGCGLEPNSGLKPGGGGGLKPGGGPGGRDPSGGPAGGKVFRGMALERGLELGVMQFWCLGGRRSGDEYIETPWTKIGAFKAPTTV